MRRAKEQSFDYAVGDPPNRPAFIASNFGRDLRSFVYTFSALIEMTAIF
jgi:hypothetical protein